jgi:sortase A
MAIGSGTSAELDAPAPGPAAQTPTAPRRTGIDRALTYTGEILITVGVLLGLFVVWQLFYTDVQSGRAQEAALEELEWVEPVVAHGDDTGTIPDVEVVQLIPPDQMHFSPEGAPVVPTPAIAETFATLHVPRWGAGYVKPISEGVSRKEVLDKLGIGHYPGTVMPGQVGNFAMAGHRTTYGKPFADADKLEVGDALVVQTADAWFVYEVTTTKIVKPNDVYVIGPNPLNPGNAPTAASITLTTCHPKFSAAQRMIVHGELKYWAPVGVGMPPELYEEP